MPPLHLNPSDATPTLPRSHQRSVKTDHKEEHQVSLPVFIAALSERATGIGNFSYNQTDEEVALGS